MSINTTNIIDTLQNLIDETNGLSSQTGELQDYAENIERSVNDAVADAENAAQTARDLQSNVVDLENQLREALEVVENFVPDEPVEETGEQLLARAIAKLVAEAVALEKMKAAALAAIDVKVTDGLEQN